jgi:hypothetical protein
VEDEFWQRYKNQNVRVIGVDVWNGSPSQLQNFAQGGGRNVTFPLGLMASSVGTLYGLDRHSFVIIDADGIVQYISPQSTHYTQRYTRHKDEMIAKIEELLMITDVEEDDGNLPGNFRLHQNWPNPFSDNTRLAFEIGAAAQSQLAKLTVYDILGREVRTLVSGQFAPGRHEALWDGRNERGARVPSGIYFYVLQAGPSRLVKRLVMVTN